MGTARRSFSSVDEQIFECIAAAKIQNNDAKLEDFQLRVVVDDLVLCNLKTGETFLIIDDESDGLGWYAGTSTPPQILPDIKVRHTSTSVTELTARRAASIAVRSESRLANWFAPSETIASSPPKAISR